MAAESSIRTQPASLLSLALGSGHIPAGLSSAHREDRALWGPLSRPRDSAAQPTFRSRIPYTLVFCLEPDRKLLGIGILFLPLLPSFPSFPLFFLF